MGKVVAVVKQFVLYIFPISYFWGTIYINRSNQNDAINTLNRESIAINKNHYKIILFPEGTRGDGKKLLRFKKGPFRMAIQNQCCIQPVVVSRYSFMDFNEKKFENGKCKLSLICKKQMQSFI